MKVKMSFNAAAMLAWLVNHGEKLAFGLVMAVMLFAAYSGWRKERLTAGRNADALTRLTSSAQERIAASTWNPAEQKLEVLPGDYLAQLTRQPINAEKFELTAALDPPLGDPLAKREDPVLLAVMELQVAGGRGMFSANSPGAVGGDRRPPSFQPPERPGGREPGREPGRGEPRMEARGERPQVAYWAVVTGLIPLRKQEEEFERALARAARDETIERGADSPVYTTTVIVERAEDVGSLEDLKWTLIDQRTVQNFKSKWGRGGSEIVDSKYVQEGLTMPLGPLIGEEWDGSVAHPKIPLLPRTGERSFDRSRGRDQEEPSAEEPPPVSEESGDAEEERSESPGTSRQPQVMVDQTPEFRLFRFFDYSARQGKQYRYRVALELKNPNYEYGERYLSNPESRKEKVRRSPWSEPSPSVRIPRGERLWASAVKKEPKTGGDPAATVMVTSLDPKMGLELAREIEVLRGSLANFSKGKANAVDPVARSVREIEDVSIQTDTLVVDVRGGAELPGKETEPGEVLVLDPDGNLYTLSELNDRNAVEARRPRKDSVDSRDGGPGRNRPGGDPRGARGGNAERRNSSEGPGRGGERRPEGPGRFGPPR